MSGHSRKIGHESSEDLTLRRQSPTTAYSTLGGPRTPVVGLIPSDDRRAHILRSTRDARDDIFVAGAPRRGAARVAGRSIALQHCGRRPGPAASNLAPIARFLSQLRALLLRRRVVPEKRLETKLSEL